MEVIFVQRANKFYQLWTVDVPFSCAYLTFSLDTHVEAAGSTACSVLHTICQLDDDVRFLRLLR
jgi:hypothetical protein